MKKNGILNAQLSGLIAGLGHKDIFLICDVGMPIPKGIEIVDLALIGGIPSFKDVFDAVVNEVEIEKYTMAEDVKQTNVDLLEHIQKNLNKSEAEYIPHVDLKEMSKNVKFAIRTGEFSYYPNIILQAGVVF